MRSLRLAALLYGGIVVTVVCPASGQRPARPVASKPTRIHQAQGQPLSEKEKMLRACQVADSTAAVSLDGVRQRADCWKQMQLQGMGDSVVDARYQAALDDYVAAARADSTKAQTDSSSSAIGARMAAIQRALQESRIDDADRVINEVLLLQPNNQRALAFHDRVLVLQRTRRTKTILVSLAAGIVLIGAGLGVLARVLARRHEQESEARRVAEAQRKAMVEIVDGIGRGKMYTIEGPIFRIGSAVSDRPEEKNDLILSDESAFISRYHCSIVRKSGGYFLIDSSLNGTYLGDELLERGEHRALEDGAEFSIAGMARFKFLLI